MKIRDLGVMVKVNWLFLPLRSGGSAKWSCNLRYKHTYKSAVRNLSL